MHVWSEAMHVWSYEVASPGVASYAEDRTTRRLLLCGIVAGPVFVAAGLLQSFTIPGFDLTHHYLSQLSSGELGWMRWAVYSVATGIVSFGLPSVPNPWGGVFLFVAAAVAWVWIAALSVRLTRQLS
jgi:hypothetical protein